jgi:hypothetical protein
MLHITKTALNQGLLNETVRASLDLMQQSSSLHAPNPRQNDPRTSLSRNQLKIEAPISSLLKLDFTVD